MGKCYQNFVMHVLISKTLTNLPECPMTENNTEMTSAGKLEHTDYFTLGQKNSRRNFVTATARTNV